MEDNKTAKIVGAFILGCLLLGIIITMSQTGNKPLTGYVDDNNSNIVTTVEPYVVTTEVPDMQWISDESVGLALYVPAGWTRLIKNGNVTFVDRDTTAYVQIVKSGYFPGLSNANEESVRGELANAGCNFVSFTKNGNYGHTVLYQQYSGDVLYDYIEVTRIDLRNVVRITVCSPDAVFKQLESAITMTANSVSWSPANPIPDGYFLAYNEFGAFEFAVPSDWDRYVLDGEFVARDRETGAEMHVGVSQSTATYANVNQGTFAEYMSPGKAGFGIERFTVSNNLVYCVSSYNIDSIPVYRVDYMLATGAYEYTLCFICPKQYYQQKSGMFEEAFKLFRTF